MAIGSSWVRVITKCIVFNLCVVLCFIIMRAFIFTEKYSSKHSNIFPEHDIIHLIGNKQVENLCSALRFKTISWDLGIQESHELLKLQKFLREAFPVFHSSSLVHQEIVNDLSLLYHVKGKDTSLKPYLLMTHLDVVPVQEELWEVPPFDCVIKNGFIYGRGAMDAKHILMGILEALEIMLERGYQPMRSFYLAFGHDEEIMGINGAKKISGVLKARKIDLEYVLDEGLVITKNVLSGISQPVALIGITEKGFLTVTLQVNLPAGHSSAPPKETAIGILAAAVNRLETSSTPSLFGQGPEKATFEELIPYVSFPLRLVFSNLWLFSPFLSSWLSKQASSNALVRTTCAVTIFNGGYKMNVIPSTANATVNCRIHPAETVFEVLNWIRKTINDNRVLIEIVNEMEPHPVSPFSSAFGYQVIKHSIQQTFPSALVAPGTLMANTDTRYYLNFTNCIYRFSPLILYPLDVFRIHGNDERISIENYKQLIQFYVQLIHNSDLKTFEDSRQHTKDL